MRKRFIKVFAESADNSRNAGSPMTLVPKITADQLDLTKIQNDPRFRIVEQKILEGCITIEGQIICQ